MVVKPPRARLLAFYLVLVCLTVILVEALATAAYVLAFGEWVSYRQLQAMRRGVLQASAGGPSPGDQLGYWIAHPYYGFVTNPEPIGWSVNEFGFFGHERQIQQADPDKLMVAVVGGSFATQFALDDYAGETLKAGLRTIEAFRTKQIVLVNLGNGSYKQPQGLFVVTDIVARGGHIDILIALDGFNEIALPEAQGNVANGISPFFPQAWRQLVDGRPSRNQLTLAAKAQISADARAWMAATFARPVLRYLVSANLVWRVADLQLARTDLYRTAALEEPPVNPDSRLSNDKRGFLGPPSDYATRRELYIDIARNWARSSLLLNNMMAERGGTYLHVLQPNQYVPHSKPLSDNEKRNAIVATSAYRGPVEIGYPYLRAMGQSLRAAGLWFEDMTEIFAHTASDLYVDSCCHLSKAGYDMIAREVVAALKSRLERDDASRVVAMTAIGDQTMFAPDALRAIAATPDYRDGSDDALRRPGSQPPAGNRISPESWHAVGSGSYKIRGDAVLMEGPNQVFTVRDCGGTQCKVAFSVHVSRAEAADIGLYLINDKGRLISEQRRPVSNLRGEARLELVAPPSTTKVRAFVHNTRGAAEFTAATLTVEPAR